MKALKEVVSIADFWKQNLSENHNMDY